MKATRCNLTKICRIFATFTESLYNYMVILSLKISSIFVKKVIKLLAFIFEQPSYQSTLKAPITTAAEDKFCDIFPNFFKQIRYGIL